MSKHIKKRLLRAKMTLHQTIQSILKINRDRQKLTFLSADKVAHYAIQLEEDLRVLNKIAAHQANLIQHYQMALEAVPKMDKRLPRYH